MLWCCQEAPTPPPLDQTIALWEGESVAFLPDTVWPNDGTWNRYDAGRILMRPFVFPHCERRCSIDLEVTLRSAGDPWDKSGAVFALAGADGRRFIDRLQDGIEADTTQYLGVMLDERGYPALELMRFLTPFGAGHFSTHPKAESWRPVYVAKWEDEVRWQRDLSAFQPWFDEADTLWIGVYIDTWTSKGYEIEGALHIKESALECDLAPTHRIIPFWNTTRYTHDQREYNGFASAPLKTTLEGIGGRVSCGLITTGHGGHEGGDEFTPQLHQLAVDGDTLKSWTPWRDDCAAFRRFNPSSGSWMVDHLDGQERLASSDLSRSNWCPGSQVLPELIDLGYWEGGEHEISLSIPHAQLAGPDAFNFWNVSGYLMVESMD